MTYTKRNLIESFRASCKGVRMDLADLLDDACQIKGDKELILPRETRKEFAEELKRTEAVINKVRRKLNIKVE